MNNGFTPTEQAILAVLSDGMAHHRDELRALLPDDLGSPKNLQMHLTRIRRRLRPHGQDIICEFSHRQSLYRHVRLLGRE